MTLVAPRSVNDVSYVLRINHDIHFEWQAHYLLRCVVDGCSIYLTGIIWVPCLCAPRRSPLKFPLQIAGACAPYKPVWDHFFVAKVVPCEGANRKKSFNL